MATSTDNEISVLNDLIEVTLDSVKGYEDAADQAKSEDLKAAFGNRAAERRGVVADLQDMVRARGGNPETEDSILGKAHRAFLNLKNAVMGRDDNAVLQEVDRGEDHLKSSWQKALDGDLSPDLRARLQQHYTSVREGHDIASVLKTAAPR